MNKAAKVAALLVAVLLLAAAGAAVRQPDSFEDGDFTNNPTWYEDSGNSGNYNISVVTGPESAPDGSHYLNMNTAEFLIPTLWHDRGTSDSIDTGDTYQTYFRSNDTHTATYALSNQESVSGNDAVQVRIAGTPEFRVATYDSTGSFIGQTTAASWKANVWYKLNLTFDTGSSEVTLKVWWRSNQSLKGSATQTYSGATDLQYVGLRSDEGNTAPLSSTQWDAVSYSELEKNNAPSIDSTATFPPNPDIGDGINEHLNGTDPDGDTCQAWSNVTYSNGTGIAYDTMTGTGSCDFELIDHFTARDGTVFVNWTLGDGQAASNNVTASTSFTLSDDAPTVTVFEPSGTAFDYDRSYSFHANDTDDRPGETFTCDLTNGTVTFDTVSGQENLSASGTFRGDLGTRSLSVSCDDGNGNTGSDSSTYTVTDFRVDSNTTRPNVFETEDVNFLINVTVGDMVDQVNTTLYWNDTSVNLQTEIGNGNVRFLNRTHVHTTPLVKANNTAHPWNFEISRNRTTFSGGSTSTTENTTTGNQNVFHAYSLLEQRLIGDPYLAGETYDVRTNYTYKTGKATLTGTNTYYRTSTETPTTTLAANIGENITLQGRQKVGTVDTPLTDQYQTTNRLLVEFQGDSRTITPGNSTLTIQQPTLTACGKGNSTVLTFNTFNESDRKVPVFSDLDMAIEIWKVPDTKLAYNFSSQDATTHQFCLFPSGASVTASTTEKLIQYEDDTENVGPFGFNRRSYFIINETLNSSKPTKIPLYMIAKNISETVEFQIEGEDGTPAEGIVARIQRYFPGEDRHLTVAMIRTGAEGQSETFLEVNEIYYQFQLFRDREFIAFRDDQIIPSDNSVFFQLGAEATPDYFEFKNKVGATCAEGATYVNCTYSSRTEALENITLRTYRQDAVTLVKVCEVSAQTISGELVCDGLNTTQNRYKYNLRVEMSGESQFTLVQDWLGTVEDLFGGIGVMAAFMLVVTSAAAGLFLPEAAIIFTLTAVIISWAIGMLPMPIEAAMSLIAVAMVLLWRLTR